MLQPDFNPEPVAVRIYRCCYAIKCKARSCLKRATVVAEKVDNVGRHAGQVELCYRHCDFVIARERVAAASRFQTGVVIGDCLSLGLSV